MPLHCSIPSKSQQLWCLVPPAASGVYYTAVSNVGGASTRTQHELFIKKTVLSFDNVFSFNVTTLYK